MIAAGFSLQPDDEFLERCAALIDEVDCYEVTPETLWFERGDGKLVDNGFFRRFLALRERSGKPFVAHGVGVSMATDSAMDRPRRRRWLARVARDHQVFRFGWWTDHLGASALDGLATTLPVPLPPTSHAAGVVRRRLRAMQRVVPDVGVENNVGYFFPGDPLDEARFLGGCLAGRRTWLLLDLHNLYTMAQNLGFDTDAWLARVDLGRVIEIHLAGGRPSNARWLPTRRVMRLDSHDDAVPEPVWALLDRVLPRCPNLRLVTLERMEGTVLRPPDASALRGELRRMRRALRRYG